MLRRACFIAVLCAPGCGRLAFEPMADAQTATGDGAVAACDRTAPYGVPALVAGLSDPVVFEATLRLLPDERRGYLWTNRSGNIDIELATRPDLSSPFSVTAVSELNTTAQEFEPTVSIDDHVLVFMSDRPGGSGGKDLYIAQRATTALPFTVLGPVTAADTAANENQPFLGANELYFSSDRAGDPDIWRAMRTGPTTFGPPARVDEVSLTGTQEADAVLSADGLTLYFTSDRAGGLGSFDLYVTTRATTSDAFAAPTHLPQLSTPAGDGVSWESVDGCRLYMASAVLGTPDVYVATRPN